MTTTLTDPNRTARLAGALYVIPWVLSLLAFFLRQNIFVAGDAAATASNVIASEGLLRLSLVSDFIVQAVFIGLVFVLYRLLKPVNKNHALLMVILFLVSVPIAMLNLLNLVAPLLLLSGADALAAFTPDQLHALVPVFSGLHEYGVMIAYIFWGLWLFPLGYLVFKSGFLPKLLGILVMIGCFGYLFDFFMFYLLPNVNLAVNMVTGWGELLLCLWLLIKGVNVDAWKKQAAKSA